MDEEVKELFSKTPNFSGKAMLMIAFDSLHKHMTFTREMFITPSQRVVELTKREAETHNKLRIAVQMLDDKK